jgi:hypothetical protein
MKKLNQLLVVAAPALMFLAVIGCESEGGGGGNVSGGVYYGVGLYDPWYYGGYYHNDIIVTPPDRPDRPPLDRPRPEHPMAKPMPATRPTPSIPTGPRISPRR